MQEHPLTGRPVHADFHTINLKSKIKVHVPVELVGEPAGVTQQGGTLEQLVREVEVECLPNDLLEVISVDVSELNVGEHIYVADISLDADTYAVLTAGDVALAGVAAPRVEAAAAEGEEGAEGEAEAGSEPEVITEKKEEAAEAEAES